MRIKEVSHFTNCLFIRLIWANCHDLSILKVYKNPLQRSISIAIFGTQNISFIPVTKPNRIMALKATYLQALILLFACFANAQEQIPLTIVDGTVTFESVAKIDSLSGSEIHERALNWIGTAFKNAEAVIKSDTPSRIVGDFILYYDIGLVNADYKHRMTIDIKDGKIKFLVSAYLIEAWLLKSGGTEWRTNYPKIKDDVQTKLNALYQSLLTEIQSNDSDW